MKLFILLSLFITCTVLTPAAGINARQQSQKERIRAGVQSGALTRSETRTLVRQQKNIQNTKARAAADGVITRREKKNIVHKQNAANRAIYAKKHNGRTR